MKMVEKRRYRPQKRSSYDGGEEGSASLSEDGEEEDPKEGQDEQGEFWRGG